MANNVNKVEWFEVLGQDPAKLRGFYGELFGWKLQPIGVPGMDYATSDKAETGIGGGVGKAQQGAGWATFYVSVDDPKAAVERALKLGGKVLMPVTELPMVTIAVIADPEGHPIGLAKDKPQ
jgi:hypothetical protein